MSWNVSWCWHITTSVVSPWRIAISRVRAGGIRCQSSFPLCGKLCPEVCWRLPFPIVGIPFHLWYLGYIDTFLIHSMFVQITKNYPWNSLPKQLFNQADSLMPSFMMGQDMMEQLAMMDFKHPTQCFHMWGVASGQQCSPVPNPGWVCQDPDQARLGQAEGPAHQAKGSPSRRPAGQILPPCATKHRCQGIWQVGCEVHFVF